MIFTIKNKFKSLFKLDTEKINKIEINEKVDATNNFNFKEDLYEKLNQGKVNKILVQAFSFEENINYYSTVLKEESESIKLALKYLKEEAKECNFSFLVNYSEDKNMKYSNECFENVNKQQLPIIKIKKTEALDYGKLFKKLYGKAVSIEKLTAKDISYEQYSVKKENGEKENIIILDLLYLVYLGREIKGQEASIILTVYGDAVEGNKIIDIPIGTTVKDIYTSLKVSSEDLKHVILGGVSTGECVYDLNTPLSFFHKSVIFNQSIKVSKEIPCIRCAKCLRVCPMNLNPIKLNYCFENKEKDNFIHLGGNTCVDCGLCSGVCPSSIELSKKIKLAKAYLGQKEE